MLLKSCTHPIACYIEDRDEGLWHCKWCEETDSLKAEIEALTTAIKGKAIIVEGGSLTIPGDVGYLLVHKGGTVNLPNCSLVKSLAYMQSGDRKHKVTARSEPSDYSPRP